MSTKYHTYEELNTELKNLEVKYPDLTRVYNLEEKSCENRNLMVLQISTDAKKNRSELKPMVKYVANMHGNEVLGREMLIEFAKYLLEAYTNNNTQDIKRLVDTTDIHLLASMNPDGFEGASYGSCHGGKGKSFCHFS